MSGLWKREMGLKYKFDNRPHVMPETLRSTQENRIMKADWGTPAQGIAKDTAYSTGRHFDHCFLLVLLYVYVDLFIEVVVDLHAVIRKNADISYACPLGSTQSHLFHMAYRVPAYYSQPFQHPRDPCHYPYYRHIHFPFPQPSTTPWKQCLFLSIFCHFKTALEIKLHSRRVVSWDWLVELDYFLESHVNCVCISSSFFNYWLVFLILEIS